MGKHKAQTREELVPLPVRCTVEQKAVFMNAATRRGMSASSFFCFICDHLKYDLVFFLDHLSFGPIMDYLLSKLDKSARKAGRQEARLVLIEKGFDTEPYS